MGRCSLAMGHERAQSSASREPQREKRTRGTQEIGLEVPRRDARRNEADAAKSSGRQGAGGLLLFLGAGLIVSEFSTDASSIGAGLGLLLVLVGAGLVLHRHSEDRSAS